MLNRTISPAIELPSQIGFPPAESEKLDNGSPLLLIRQGSQEVVRIELLFLAGNLYSSEALTAYAANDLMDEGSGAHSSAELAEALDYYGAYLQLESGNDWASVTLYSLSRFIADTLPYLLEILTDPAYPESEINTFASQGKQRLAVNMTKTDYLARRNFLTTLYSDQHPYGRMVTPEDYDLLRTEKLKTFHQQQYLNGFAGAIISGHFSEHDAKLIRDMINKSGLKTGQPKTGNFWYPEASSAYISKSGAIQSAIRIGRRLFNRSHPHYIPFQVMNTLLGGYFGSRLMTNIREDKGYTYGIGSGLMSNSADGYFYIATEVGAEVKDSALKEIYSEINRLQQDLVSTAELDLVKNYMTGAYQRSIDGAFALADRHKILLLNNLNISHFYEYMGKLRGVSQKGVQDMACQYLKSTDLSQVVVGP
jgi:predicted Zn-dependent peptidase